MPTTTETATHAYIKVDNPKGLMQSYVGPYKIVERPSMSTIRVKVGTFKSGAENLQLHHWSNAKPAIMRADATEGTMVTRGRPSKSSSTDVCRATDESEADSAQSENKTILPASRPVEKNSNVGGNSIVGGTDKTRSAPSVQSEGETRRPIRATRNPAPLYVDAITGPPPLPFKSTAGNPNCDRRPWSADRETIALLNYQISCRPKP